jgi:hypothetical protein
LALDLWDNRRGYAIILASHFSEEWTLLHSREFHWPHSENIGSSDIAKTLRRVASIALLLSYTSSAARSTWLEKRALFMVLALMSSESSSNVVPQKLIRLSVSQHILHHIFASLHQFLASKRLRLM